jgi:hypothetical protein
MQLAVDIKLNGVALYFSFEVAGTIYVAWLEFHYQLF